jgi:hypothetical protein
MIELLRLPEVQRIVAVAAAIASGCYSFHVVSQLTIAYAMKRTPNDGQAGLGAVFMGGMAAFLVASVMYSLVFHFMRTWEKRYAQKLDKRERLEDIQNLKG